MNTPSAAREDRPTSVAKLTLDVLQGTTGRGVIQYWKGSAWTSVSATRWRLEVNRAAAGLIAAGLQRGGRVMLMAETSIEWLLVESATVLAGGVLVPVYANRHPTDVAWMANDSEAELLVLGSKRLLREVVSAQARFKTLKRVICVDHPDDGAEDDSDRTTRRGVFAEGALWNLDALREAATDASRAELEARGVALEPTDLLSIVYTSGTTGRPKGAVLTHDALLSQLSGLAEVLPLTRDDVVYLGLPLSHIFARVVAWHAFVSGATLVCPRGRKQMLDDLGQCRPTVWPVVPQLLAEVQSHVLAQVRAEGQLRRRWFTRAHRTGLEVSQLQQQGQAPQGLLAQRYAVARRTALRALPEQLGGRLRFVVCGGAPLPVRLAEWFHAFGIDILEGYGLTETCAAVTVNTPNRYKFGTVGRPIPGVEVALAEDGEVLVRGPSVMSRYHRREAETARVLSDDGWFSTGDIGELDRDGFLSITDRKRDIIVTAGGKNIAPQNIEAHLKESPLIAEAMVCGEGQRFLVALLVLDEEALRAACAAHQLLYTDYVSMSQHPRVYQQLQQVMDERNQRLASYEMIRRFHVLSSPLSVATGDVTPSGKLRRKLLMRRHAGLLKQLYDDGPALP